VRAKRNLCKNDGGTFLDVFCAFATLLPHTHLAPPGVSVAVKRDLGF
jgi:hypothetical protein